MSNKCFLGISQFEKQIGISEYFSWKVHGFIRFLERSSIFVAHSDEKLGVRYNFPPPFPHLVAKPVSL